MREIPARRATSQRYFFGEGLRYDEERATLSWVDLTAGRLFEAPLDDLDAAEVVVQTPGPLGAASPLADGSGWILAAGRGLAVAERGGAARSVADLEPESNRMNDAACDSAGRFWAGSMAWDEAAGAGSLHRVDLDGRITRVLGGIGISNGPAWSPDGSVLYLDDSGRRQLLAFDMSSDGTLSRRRVLVEFGEGAGDGLTVDHEGHLWVAVYGGSAVNRYDPEGRLVVTVTLPASQVTSCCLAGGRLYATTTPKGLSDPEPDAGRLFVADVGVEAPAVRPYRGSLPAL